MWWMPLAWLGWKALRALIEWDQKEAAKYRCHICRNDSHTTEEYRHSQLSVSRRAELDLCLFHTLKLVIQGDGPGRVALVRSERSRFSHFAPASCHSQHLKSSPHPKSRVYNCAEAESSYAIAAGG